MSSDDEVRGELRYRPERQKTAELPHVDVRQLELLLQSMRPPGRTFGELAREWHAVRAKTLVEPRNEERHIRHLAPLHELAEAELLPMKVEKVLASLLKENGGKLSRSTTNKVRGTGLQVVDWARANRLWREANPFGLTKRLKNPKPTNWNTLSLDEARRLLNGPWMKRSDWREVCVSLGLGLRPGEVKGQLKKDVDLPRRMLTVRRSNDRDVTKTYRNRVVPVPEWLVPVLQEAMVASPSEYVFPDPFGKLQRFDADKSEMLRKALKRAGVDREDVTYYGLRHTCATLHREAGCDPLVIKHALGHSVNNPTDDLYTHVSFGYAKGQLEKLKLLEPGNDPEGKKEVDGDLGPPNTSGSSDTEESSMDARFPSLGPGVQIPSTASKRYLSLPEVSEVISALGIQVHPDTIRNHVEAGRLKAGRLGGVGPWQVSRAELSRYLEASGFEPLPEVAP